MQSSNPQLGVISAQNPGQSGGRPMLMNAAIERIADGSKISLSFSTPAGAMSSEGTVRDSNVSMNLQTGPCKQDPTAHIPIRSIFSN